MTDHSTTCQRCGSASFYSGHICSSCEQRRSAVYDAAMAWYKAKCGSAGDITEIVKYREARLRDACAVAEEVERV